MSQVTKHAKFLLPLFKYITMEILGIPGIDGCNGTDGLPGLAGFVGNPGPRG